LAVRRLTLIPALAIAVAWPGAAVAGAWLQKAGETYVKVSGAYLYSTERFNSDGDIVPLDATDPTLLSAAFRDVSLTAYLEYGLDERVTLVVSLPWKALTSRRTEFTTGFDAIREIEAVNTGATDLRVGARLPLRRTGFPVSIEARAKLPLGYDPEPDQEQLPPLGSGKVDIEALVLAGAGLWPFPGYLSAGAGYRLRGGGLDGEVLATAEGGASWRRWFGKVALDATYATGDLVDADPTRTVTNENILKLTGEVNFEVLPWLGLSAEVFHVLGGANTVAGTTWVAGAVFRRAAVAPGDGAGAAREDGVDQYR
jgi:hypothetical protein